MGERIFLLVNLALGFYNVGTIWAHEVDIFRGWQLVDAKDFLSIQDRHWHKLPYWVFIPVGLGLAGAIALVWIHPANSPPWAIFWTPASQLISLLLTGAFWGRWQAKLAKDPKGSGSPYLAKILQTHWIRTFLITSNGLGLLLWAIFVFG